MCREQLGGQGGWHRAIAGVGGRTEVGVGGAKGFLDPSGDVGIRSRHRGSQITWA